MISNYYLRNWLSLLPLLFDTGRYTNESSKVTQYITETYFGKGNVFDNGLRMDKKIIREVSCTQVITIFSS
jgi:hypothetical protein